MADPLDIPGTVVSADDLDSEDHDLTQAHRDFGARELVMQTLSDNGDQTSSFSVNVTGANDPIVAMVSKRYAERFSRLQRGDPKRSELAMSYWREVKAMKDLDAAQNSSKVSTAVSVVSGTTTAVKAVTSTVREATVKSNKTEVNNMRVTFDFGPLGTHSAIYGHVQVFGDVVLLASPLENTAGYYEPPADKHFMISIEGYPVPLVVMKAFTYPFNEWQHCTLVIVETGKPEEVS